MGDRVHMEPNGAGSLSLAGKLALAAVALLMGLGAAELVMRAARASAFPYLNIFERSSRYGVVLAPSDEARVRTRTGRITEIRTNALGFRGPEWTAATDGKVDDRRVLLLGDSQMLGYGVDELDAPAAVLGRTLGDGWQVLPAASPSWGPIEYVRALEDLGPTFRPGWVVAVINAASDWSEAKVPNSERSDAQDGWLTRFRRNAPKGRPVPGRSWLYGRSHLVFGLRELWALRGVSRDRLVPEATVAERLIRDLDQNRRARGSDRSPFGGHLDALSSQCAQLGCRLVVVALPIDLQVDDREWEKYRRKPRVDLGPTKAMLEDVVADAERRGIPALDALPPLEVASPGAFLPDDDHLSPKGQAVLARAIADLITQGRAPSASLGGRP